MGKLAITDNTGIENASLLLLNLRAGQMFSIRNGTRLTVPKQFPKLSATNVIG
jgi:hypothetical protein